MSASGTGTPPAETAPTQTPPSGTAPAGPPAPAAAASGRPAWLRLAIVVLGVLALQLAFVASYTGALHDPSPHDVPAAVVAPQPLVDKLNASLGPAQGLLRARSVPDEAAARRAIDHREVYGAYVPGPDGTARLLVASGRSSASVELMTRVFTEVAKATNARLTVTDVAPVRADDSRGLTSFYLAIGWTVGGYLVAIALGLFAGMTPAGGRAAAARLAILAGYSVVAGFLGALIVVHGYGYLPGHTAALGAVGALVVFAVAAFTALLGGLLGIVGSFLAILLFVVLGNPSAGGPWPVDMLDEPWRSVGPWLPNGAALTAIRQVEYFAGQAVAGPLGVLAGFAAVGVTGLFVVARRGRPVIDLTGGTT